MESIESHACNREGVELVSHQLKNMVNVWYNQWDEGQGKDVEWVWDEFENVFLDHFFSLELREVMIEEFVNMK